MKVTNGEVWGAKEPLQQLLKEPWPVKTAYSLAKLARKVNGQANVIEQVRVKLITQYGVTNEKNQTVVEENGPNWEPFVAAFNELMAQEEEMDFEKVVLPEVEGLCVLPAVLLPLMSFVEVL